LLGPDSLARLWALRRRFGLALSKRAEAAELPLLRLQQSGPGLRLRHPWLTLWFGMHGVQDGDDGADIFFPVTFKPFTNGVAPRGPRLFTIWPRRWAQGRWRHCAISRLPQALARAGVGPAVGGRFIAPIGAVIGEYGFGPSAGAGISNSCWPMAGPRSDLMFAALHRFSLPELSPLHLAVGKLADRFLSTLCATAIKAAFATPCVYL